ncbi:MAG: hypothetical protein E7393_05545 [Ruminococcaceae bacterium]|nr:hypothetical protein [Oscillospiraceae bacterium]
MSRKMKQFIALLLTVCMLCSVMPITMAATVNDFMDFPTGWSKEAMTAAVDNGLLSGVTSNEIRPQANLTRAEAATIITRAFGAVTKADISSYVDVSPSAWYYESIAKAVKMGALNGKSSTHMEPDAPITREEIFTILARVLVLSDESLSGLSRFGDGSLVSDWAASSVSALAVRYYVNGDDEGNVNPKAYITREEFAQLMYNTIKTYLTKSTAYEGELTGIVVVRVGDVSLNNATIHGDLVLGDGVGLSAVLIQNTTIQGRLLARGGYNTLRNTTTQDGVVVKNMNGVTRFNNRETESVFKGMLAYTPVQFITGVGPASSGGSSDGNNEDIGTYKVIFKVLDEEVARFSIEEYATIGSRMPSDPVKNGYTFHGWYDENGDPVDSTTVVDRRMTVTADMRLITYTANFHNRGEIIPVTYTIEDPSLPSLLTQDEVTVPGADYVLDGWYDGDGNPVSSIPAISIGAPLTIDVYARWKVPIYYNDAGDYVLIIENGTFGQQLPVPNEQLGYTFDGWYDENGDPVDENTSVGLNGFTIEARFSINTYMLTLYDDDETTILYSDDFDVLNKITLENIDFDSTTDGVQTPGKTGKVFLGWFTAASGGTQVTGEVAIPAGDIRSVALYAHWEDATLTVNFYEGYNETYRYLTESGIESGAVQIAYGKSFAEAQLSVPQPKRSIYKDPIFTINPDDFPMSDGSFLYPAEEILYAYPALWYVDDSGKMVPFDENVSITKNMSVFMLYKNFGVNLYLNDETALVSTSYELDETRAVDSAKGLLINGGTELNLAIQQDRIPNYDERIAALYNRLASTGVMDSSGNIKIYPLSVPISQFISETTAAGMIKTYIRDVINDPTLLESMLTMIDASILVNEIGVENLIGMLTDVDLLQLIKNQKAASVDFIYGDLTSATSQLRDEIVAYVRTDGEFRGMLINEAVGVLKGTITNAPMKSAILSYIQGQLSSNQPNDLQNLFVDTILTSLRAAQNSTASNPYTDPYGIMSTLRGGALSDLLMNSLLPANDGNPVTDPYGIMGEIKTYDSDLNKQVASVILDAVDEEEDFDEDPITGESQNPAIQYLVGQIKTDHSDLQMIVIDDLEDKLAARNEAILNKVIFYVKDHLTAEEENIIAGSIKQTLRGVDGTLRELVLTEESIKILLENPSADTKTMLIGELVSEDVLTVLLSDSTLKQELLLQALTKTDFVDYLYEIDQFKSYVIGEVKGYTTTTHLHETLVNLSLTDSMTTELLSEIKSDDTFKALFAAADGVTPEGELRQTVLDSIVLSDYVSDESDFWAYILDYGTYGNYDFISSDMLATIRNTCGNPHLLSDPQKQLAYNEGLPVEARSELETQFASFKTGVVNDLAAGNDIANEDAKTTINEYILELVQNYANDVTGPADDVIESILLSYVRDLLTTSSGDDDIDALVEELKDAFIQDVENGTISVPDEDIIDFAATHTDIMKSVVEDDYDTIISYIAEDVETVPELKTQMDSLLKRKAEEIATVDIINLLDAMLVHIDEVDDVDPLEEQARGFIIDEIDRLLADPADTTIDEGVQSVIAGMSAKEIHAELVDVLHHYDINAIVLANIQTYISGLSFSEIQTIVSENETMVRSAINTYINGDGTADNPGLTDATLATKVLQQEDAVRGVIISEIGAMSEDTIAGYLKDFLNPEKNTNAASNETMVRSSLDTFLIDSNGTNASTITGLIQDYISACETERLNGDSTKADALKEGIGGFIDELDSGEDEDVAFIAANRTLIINGLNNVDISSVVNNDLIIQYINQLGDDEAGRERKRQIADKIYEVFTGLPHYAPFMDSMQNNEPLMVTKENLTFITIANAAIGGLTYASITSNTDNPTLERVEQILGEEVLAHYCDTAIGDYSDGLSQVIEEVDLSVDVNESASYTTDVTVYINIVDEILAPLYEKAKNELVARLAGAGVYYDENPYLQYLATQNLIGVLFDGDSTAASGNLTGYTIKPEMDYYDHMVNTLIVADDALTWYGDEENVPVNALDAVKESVVGEALYAHERIGELLEAYHVEGSLPSQLENVINSIDRVNDLLVSFHSQISNMLNRYLGSNLNQKFETDQVLDNERFQTAFDIMIGVEDPVFTIDSLYDLFYRYDEALQERLQTLIDSGRLQAAVTRFEELSFGGLGSLGSAGATLEQQLNEIRDTGKVQSAFNSLYDVLVVVAEHGIEPFRVDENVTNIGDERYVEDAYAFSLRGLTVKLSRFYAA